MKTLVGVNALTSVNAMAYNSHCQEWFTIAKEFPDDIFLFWTPHRLSIDNMRNQCFEMAERNDFDYLYFIDDDTILTPGTYGHLRRSMEKHSATAVMAHTIIRGYPFNTMAFIDPSDKGFENKDLSQWTNIESFNDWKDYILPDGLIRVDAIGCSTVLFKMEDLRKLVNRPLFRTINTKELCVTEDVYLCAILQAEMGRQNVKIFVDTNVPTGHIMDPEVVWPKSVELFRKRGEEDCQLQSQLSKQMQQES